MFIYYQCNMKRYVYILQLVNGQYYVGSTNDIKRRYMDHVNWHTITTKRVSVEKLLFEREYNTKTQARKIEMFLKKQKSRVVIKKFMSNQRNNMAL